MPETYEKDGIIYFKEPYKVKVSEWGFDILGCNTVIKDDSWSDNYITVYCYASKPEYNSILRKVKNEKYKGCKILHGIDPSEVNSIV